MDLLPRDYSEFRSQAYWDRFFRARKGRAFEWYGDWEDLQPLLALPHCIGGPQRSPGGGAGSAPGAKGAAGAGGAGGVTPAAAGASGEGAASGGDSEDSSGSAVSAVSGETASDRGDAPLKILVPGCGNSELSARLYDFLLPGAAPKTPSPKSSGPKTSNPKTPGVAAGSAAAAPGAPRYAITNIDFSEVVIKEMAKKNSRARPGMEWLVMDMTATSFPENYFDVILDKGCLDALMGEEGAEAEASGEKFLAEIARLVKPGAGRYLCVTLAQEHVLSVLLKKFRNQDWAVTILKVPLPDPSQAPGAPSPVSSLHPFLVVVTHTGVSLATTGAPHSSATTPTATSTTADGNGTVQGGESHGEQLPAVLPAVQPAALPAVLPAVQLAFDTRPAPGADRSQLEDVLKVVDRENRARAALSQLARERQLAADRQLAEGSSEQDTTGGDGSTVPGLPSDSDPTVGSTVRPDSDALPAFSDSDTESLRDLEPGRRMERRLGERLGVGVGPSVDGGNFDPNAGEYSGGSGGSVKGWGREEEGKGPRFVVTVLDAKPGMVADIGSLPCAVFLVPQGREHEWLFSSEDGQWDLVSSANAQRLILVCLGRTHAFGSSQQVQDELSPLVLPLAPDSCRPHLPSDPSHSHSHSPNSSSSTSRTNSGSNSKFASTGPFSGGFKGPPKAPFKIPYMTTSDGIGWRRVVAETFSPISGPLTVEDVEPSESSEALADLGYTRGSPSQTGPSHSGVPQAGGVPVLLRRMVFGRNSGLIQSEAVLTPIPTLSSSAAAEGGSQQSHKSQAGKSQGTKSQGGKSQTGKSQAGKSQASHKSQGPTSQASHKSQAAPASQATQPPSAPPRATPLPPLCYSKDGVPLAVDPDVLSSAYHAAMLAGLTLIGPSLLPQIQAASQQHTTSSTGQQQSSTPASGGKHEPSAAPPIAGQQGQQGQQGTHGASSSEGEGQRLRALIVGLGGGALPSFLRRHFPFDSITVAELDPCVHALATEHFGYREDNVLRTFIGDGVALVERAAGAVGAAAAGAEGAPPETAAGARAEGAARAGAEGAAAAAPEAAAAAAALALGNLSLETSEGAGIGLTSLGREMQDLIIVDADSDDAGSGMSCPAPVFVGERFLRAARGALKDGGTLLINVVARSQRKFDEAVAQVQRVFPHVYMMNVDEDVNRVLFALASPAEGDTDGVMDQRALKMGAVRLVAAASKFHPWGRGPSLVKLVGGIQKMPLGAVKFTP